MLGANCKLTFQLTTVIQINWRSRVTVALASQIYTVLIDAALASVNACIAARPEIFCIPSLVVPPTIGNVVVLKRRKITVVLG